MIRLVIVLVVFGPGRLPEMMGHPGKGLQEFNKGLRKPARDREGAPERRPVENQPRSLTERLLESRPGSPCPRLCGDDALIPIRRQNSGCARFHRSCSKRATPTRWARGMST